MEEFLIKKRLKELCKNEILTSKSNANLFVQYEIDKRNNVVLEDSEARTLLILGNQKIIYFVLKKQYGMIGDLGDREEFSVGQIGLVKAVDTFDNSKGISFITYAYRVIDNEIKMYYRKLDSKMNQSEKNKIFLEDYIQDVKEENTIKGIDMLKSDEDFVQDVADKDLVDNVMANLKYLTENEAKTVVYYFGLCGKQQMNQPQIAKMLGKTHSIISRYLKLGLYKLKVLSLNDEDLTRDDKIFKYEIIKKWKDKQNKQKL